MLGGGVNDLGSNVDEVGWRQVSDSEPIVAAKMDNIPYSIRVDINTATS